MKLVKDFSIIIAAGITVGGVIYSARNHTITQAESDRRELDKELLINAFSLDDSLSQRRRLELFVDLNLFSKDMITALDNKLDSNEITFGKNTLGGYTFFDTVKVGVTNTDSLVGVSFYMGGIYISDNKYYCTGKILRDGWDNNSFKVFSEQPLPNMWEYGKYVVEVDPVLGYTERYILKVRKIR